MVDIRSNKDNLEIVNLVNGKSKNTIKRYLQNIYQNLK